MFIKHWETYCRTKYESWSPNREAADLFLGLISKQEMCLKSPMRVLFFLACPFPLKRENTCF